MNKDLSAPWPEVDGETLKSMGRFVVAWGVLEMQINNAIGDVYGFTDETCFSVTANLGTKAKIELFMSGAALYEDYLAPKVDLRDLNKMATDTGSASNKYRNLIAHGQPIPIPENQDDDQMFPKDIWTWGRFSARKGGPRATIYRLTHHIFEEATSETVSLINRWTEFRFDSAEMLSGLHALERE